MDQVVIPVLLRNLTDMRVGSKRSLISVVDLPVNKDIFGFPVIYGQSLKGAIRSSIYNKLKKILNDKSGKVAEKLINVMFGDGEHKSNLTVTDFHLVFIPITCLESGLLFITSPERLSIILDIISKDESLNEETAEALSRLIETSMNLGYNKIISSVNGREKIRVAKGLKFENITGEEIRSVLKNLFSDIIPPPVSILNWEIGIVNDNVFRTLLYKALIIQPRIKTKGLRLENKDDEISIGSVLVHNKAVDVTGPFFEEKIPKYSIFVGEILVKKWIKIDKETIELVVDLPGAIKISIRNGEKIETNAITNALKGLSDTKILIWVGANETLSFGLIEMNKLALGKINEGIRDLGVNLEGENGKIKPLSKREIFKIVDTALGYAFFGEEKGLTKIENKAVNKKESNKVKNLAQVVRRLGYEPAEQFYQKIKKDSTGEGYPQIRKFLEKLRSELENRGLLKEETSYPSALLFQIIISLLVQARYILSTIETSQEK